MTSVGSFLGLELTTVTRRSHNTTPKLCEEICQLFVKHNFLLLIYKTFILITFINQAKHFYTYIINYLLEYFTHIIFTAFRKQFFNILLYLSLQPKLQNETFFNKYNKALSQTNISDFYILPCRNIKPQKRQFFKISYF